MMRLRLNRYAVVLLRAIIRPTPLLRQLSPAALPPASPPPQQTGKPLTSGAPSLEFLEYLGEFETTDGQWIDPVSEIDNLEKAAQAVGQSQ